MYNVEQMQSPKHFAVLQVHRNIWEQQFGHNVARPKVTPSNTLKDNPEMAHAFLQ
jgi:hypothetical protein